MIMKLENNYVIKTEHLQKEYRLGVIGTGTLRHDLQSWFAKKRGKEDPNRRIGARDYEKGDTFLALDDVALEVERGERVGIIGANGAGKSTLLKLLSRITSPTDGEIAYRGRIASMLEVGTGFHPELTGRENVYLNGAILGMTKAEVDKKIDQIIEFSECEKFIDTPVKRYSSGMFVKLAFSVAAHLDAEIMIMDEVLAVGDMKFQKKCISKMRELAIDENRTVLYVSHNMGTIQDLCSRCIVLDKGKKVYDGDVDEAIKLYMGGANDEFFHFNYEDDRLKFPVKRHDLNMKSVKFNGRTTNLFYDGEPMNLELEWENLEDIPSLSMRIEVQTPQRQPITSFVLEDFYSGKKGETHKQKFRINVSQFRRGRFVTRYVFFNKKSDSSAYEDIEDVMGLAFRRQVSDTLKQPWQRTWGTVKLGDLELVNEE